MASRDLEFIDNASALSTGALARRLTKLNTMNVTVGTFTAAALTGGVDVTLITTNATPGTQTLPSAAVLLAALGELAPYSYNLRIVNTGAGTLTMAADTGATITLGAGTYTVVTNTFRDFVVSFPTATTGTVTTVGVGTWS